jgi:hypothetical protein
MPEACAKPGLHVDATPPTWLLRQSDPSLMLGRMKSARSVRLAIAVAGVAMAFLASGCGGVNATGSVSPATFFLPGFMKVAPERPAPGAPALPEHASRPTTPESGQP